MCHSVEQAQQQGLRTLSGPVVQRDLGQLLWGLLWGTVSKTARYASHLQWLRRPALRLRTTLPVPLHCKTTSTGCMDATLRALISKAS